jgi:hypothetical protein
VIVEPSPEPGWERLRWRLRDLAGESRWQRLTSA